MKNLKEYKILFFNLKWIKNLIIWPDSIKFLEENVGRKLINISCGIDFFEHDAKSTNNKSKKNQ